MTIVPIKEPKNTAAISEKCRELDEPIYVTKNGYGYMVIMSMEACRLGSHACVRCVRLSQGSPVLG